MTFASNNTGGPGGQIFFDVTVHSLPLVICRIDTNATAAVGQVVHANFYFCDGGYAGNVSNPSAWNLNTSGAAISAGPDQPVAFALSQPVVLGPGTHGVSIVLHARRGRVGRLEFPSPSRR